MIAILPLGKNIIHIPNILSQCRSTPIDSKLFKSGLIMSKVYLFKVGWSFSPLTLPTRPPNDYTNFYLLFYFHHSQHITQIIHIFQPKHFGTNWEAYSTSREIKRWTSWEWWWSRPTWASQTSLGRSRGTFGTTVHLVDFLHPYGLLLIFNLTFNPSCYFHLRIQGCYVCL